MKPPSGNDIRRGTGRRKKRRRNEEDGGGFRSWRPRTPFLDVEKDKAVEGGDDDTGPERDKTPAQNVEGDGAANDLLDVAADDGDLRLDPKDVAREPMVLDPLRDDEIEHSSRDVRSQGMGKIGPCRSQCLQGERWREARARLQCSARSQPVATPSRAASIWSTKPCSRKAATRWQRGLRL